MPFPLQAGSLRQYAEVSSGGGFGSTNSLQLEFGLGLQTQIDRLEILWPSGIQQTWSDLAVDQLITITEGEETLVSR